MTQSGQPSEAPDAVGEVTDQADPGPGESTDQADPGSDEVTDQAHQADQGTGASIHDDDARVSVGGLPQAVRHKVISLAADALGRIGPDEVPSPLRQIARFAPAKRARLGANVIAACLDADVTFRRRVVEGAVADGQLVDALREGTAPPAADPVDVAAFAYLLTAPGWTGHVEAAVEELVRQAKSAQSARESTTVKRLQEQLSAARAAARDDRERWKAEIERLKAENSALRRRLSDARDRASRAETAANQAMSQAEEAISTAETARANAEAEARRLRARLSDAETALEKARRDVREDRGIAAAKLRLLLDTLTDAARGLSQELALPPTELRPADSVEALAPGTSERVVGGHVADEDPARLEVLLGLPRVHLVVDGYNVTKLKWGDMSLEAQRGRLVRELGGLAARTRAEVTCVFDGADLDRPPPVQSPRGVRVRFSLPGQSADELICQLVRAEPEGRPVVVISSDHEIQRGVRRPGVHPVPSVALVRLVTR